MCTKCSPNSHLLFYSSQEYQVALKYVNRLLQIEPSNRQGLELQEKINQKMKEGMFILVCVV